MDHPPRAPTILAAGSPSRDGVAAPEPAAEPGSLGDLAFGSLRTHFDAMMAHEPGTRLDRDPEELHDMRVATRRLRAALSFFRAALPPAAEALRAEFGWLADALGAVRDLDVQLQQVAAWRSEARPEDRPAFDALASTIGGRRSPARGELLARLDSPRYLTLLQDFERLLQAGPPPDSPVAATPLREAVPRLVKDRHKKLRKVADHLTPASSPPEFHAARIRGKRLRYAVEFVADVYGRPARDFVRVMVALQDLLGSHQDAYVAVDQLRDVVDEQGDQLPPRTLFLMGEVAERYVTQAAGLRARFASIYRPVHGQPWRRLRKAMKS
jgi:triphosphatase